MGMKHHSQKLTDFCNWANKSPTCLALSDVSGHVMFLTGLASNINNTIESLIKLFITRGLSPLKALSAATNSFTGSLRMFEIPGYGQQFAYFRLGLRIKMIFLSRYFNAIDTIQKALSSSSLKEEFSPYLERLALKSQSKVVWRCDRRCCQPTGHAAVQACPRPPTSHGPEGIGTHGGHDRRDQLGCHA